MKNWKLWMFDQGTGLTELIFCIMQHTHNWVEYLYWRRIYESTLSVSIVVRWNISSENLCLLVVVAPVWIAVFSQDFLSQGRNELFHLKRYFQECSFINGKSNPGPRRGNMGFYPILFFDFIISTLPTIDPLSFCGNFSLKVA